MPTRALYIVAVFLIAYSSCLSAYMLAGQKITKTAYVSIIPSIAASAAFIIGKGVFALISVSLFVSSIIILGLYFTEKNWCVSSLTAIIAVSFCVSVQLVISILNENAAEILLAIFVWLLVPIFIWLSNIAIFPSDYILTSEQKKSIFSRQFFFFPGPLLATVLQTMLLTRAIEVSVYSVSFVLLLQFDALVQLKQQVKSFEERIENIIDKQYQSELLNFMQVIRSQRHDFNFHMQTIFGMINSGQYEECKEYVGSMMKYVQSTNEILPLYHPATSALLNTFREIALQKGLQMEIEIHDNLQFIASSVYETNTILGNLLQNAIDELELHPENEDRVIRLLILKRGRYNVIKVSNQCHMTPNEMSRIFVPGFTTKNSHEGLGLANALRMAQKNGGTVYPEFEEKTVHFIARIPMN